MKNDMQVSFGVASAQLTRSMVWTPRLSWHALCLIDWRAIDKKVERMWRTGVELGKRVSASGRLKAFVELRASQFAHNFDEVNFTRRTMAQLPARYGQEGRMLLTTIRVANSLNTVVRNASFDYVDAERNATRNARDLGESCRFIRPKRSNKAVCEPADVNSGSTVPGSLHSG